MCFRNWQFSGAKVKYESADGECDCENELKFRCGLKANEQAECENWKDPQDNFDYAWFRTDTNRWIFGKASNNRWHKIRYQTSPIAQMSEVKWLQFKRCWKLYANFHGEKQIIINNNSLNGATEIVSRKNNNNKCIRTEFGGMKRTNGDTDKRLC